MTRILIAEDNLDSQYMLKQLLEAKGHTVTVADHGEQALEYAKQDPPEMIISDIMMPVMNGFKLCREVKKDATLKSIPFIFYTATFVEKMDEKLGMRLGASRFIIKPMDGTRFIQIVDQVLDEHRQGILPVPERPRENETTLLEMYENSLTYKLSQTVEKLEAKQKELQKSKQRLKEAQEIAQVGHWELDLKDNTLQWSDEMYRIFGQPPQKSEATYDTFLAMVHPDDRVYVDKSYKESLAKKTQYDIDHRLLLKDNIVKWVHERCQTLYDDNGEPICSIGTVQDITERRQAAVDLQRSEKFLKRSQKIAHVGSWELDLIKNELIWSDETYRIFGLVPQESKGTYEVFLETVHPDDRAAVDAAYSNSLREGRDSYEIEHRLVRHDNNEVRIVQERCEHVRDPSGKIVRSIGMVQDITESKQLEAQLQQAQKMESIGVLAGGVAHDFNNILGVIIGNATLSLMNDGIKGSLKEEIEEIEKAGERGAALTRQLLTFSRKQIAQPEILDLNQLLAGIQKMLNRLISENVEILNILGSALWPVKIDPGQVEQVIMNLVINARDAMPKGGKLTIETTNIVIDKDYCKKHGIEEQTGSYVMLSVSDSGVGMDKEIQKYIFEPFYTTKEKGKGTGLGLSTVYGIVKQNCGIICVHSEPGQGSTFKVYLPKAKESVTLETKEQYPEIGHGGSETVLIVEDDDFFRKFVRAILKQNGYRVLDAENGKDALKISKKHEGLIELMITDVVMPEMGGEEAAEQLQSWYPRMKVIYMSGYTDTTFMNQGFLSPGFNFLQKPFSSEDLMSKVREVLDKNQT